MPETARNRDIGDRLELTRRALGYDTQMEFIEALASDMPISHQRWNAYERGRERISIPVALALCARFDLTMDWIYRGRRGDMPLRVVRAIEELEAEEVRRKRLYGN